MRKLIAYIVVVTGISVWVAVLVFGAQPEGSVVRVGFIAQVLSWIALAALGFSFCVENMQSKAKLDRIPGLSFVASIIYTVLFTVLMPSFGHQVVLVVFLSLPVFVFSSLVFFSIETSVYGEHPVGGDV